MPKINIVVEENTVRADVFLVQALKGQGFDISRAYLKRLLDEKLVAIDGISVKPSYKPVYGEVVIVDLPEPKASDILPEDIPLNIVYEDENLLVINKPCGLVVHPAPGHYTGTLVNALLYYLGSAGNLSNINGVLRPGIVHRLDKDTSGLLVVAKDDTTHRHLAAQLADRSMKRIYRAVAMGRIEEEITVAEPIGRHKKNRLKMAVDRDGRTAVTHFTPIRVFENKVYGRIPPHYTYLEAALKTGRTHQIRVHLAHMQRPVLGDVLYGPPNQPHLPGIVYSGQVLHAVRIGFIHPVNGQSMVFETELPDYFCKIIEILS
ncbi:MAG: RluA family pseudouridine synthase [Defluviitaleaceae bacterium]|nr:RluA family pseudouridine synthase [Defluviitaleaceae bacterium]